MREQLIQYVTLLFAGADGCEDVKQEILQNTLDRYDDLIAEGKAPEAAYRLSITGIGDINEILGRVPELSPTPAPQETEQDTPTRMILRALGIALYILCPIPLFILSEMNMATIGLCGTLALVAVATMLVILGAKKKSGAPDPKPEAAYPSPRQELRKSIRSAISVTCLALYLVVSFLTNAWYITWLIFPICGALKGLVIAIVDLKEENNHA